MIGYVIFGINDMVKVVVFYDKFCVEFGVGWMMEDENFIVWVNVGQGCGVGFIKFFDGNLVSVGNGVMVVFQVKDIVQVDKVYKLVVEELGVMCEGFVGLWGDGSFYVGYFCDFDGYKLNVFCMGQ